jgi:bla regulator protein blaR1
MVVDGAPMREFAGLLERLLNRKVVDGTGLDRPYDIRLEFSADQMPVPVPRGDNPDASARDGLSLFTALQEQLGLKLESERGPVDVIVIESAQLPTPN